MKAAKRKPAPKRARPAASEPAETLRARVYAAVRKIPRGRVATYGQIAELAGYPRAARAVGRALATIPGPMVRTVPWQRVVNAAGGVSRRDPEAMAAQRDFLRRDGIQLGRAGGVDLKRYGWKPPHARRSRSLEIGSEIDRAKPEDFD